MRYLWKWLACYRRTLSSASYRFLRLLLTLTITQNCPSLWRDYDTSGVKPKKNPKITYACGNCGSTKDHFIDDWYINPSVVSKHKTHLPFCAAFFLECTQYETPIQVRSTNTLSSVLRKTINTATFLAVPLDPLLQQNEEEQVAIVDPHQTKKQTTIGSLLVKGESEMVEVRESIMVALRETTITGVAAAEEEAADIGIRMSDLEI